MISQAAKRGYPAQKRAAPTGAPAADAAAGSSPAYEQGMAFVRESLYGAKAAKDVAKSLRAASDPARALADTAYEMVTIADEATNGAIPDEELVAFATEVLGEVADIAEAAGLRIRGATIAKAVQMMLVRYVTEQGMDPTQLQQAMAQVDTEAVGRELERMA
jgi:hypothetical protein